MVSVICLDHHLFSVYYWSCECIQQLIEIKVEQGFDWVIVFGDNLPTRRRRRGQPPSSRRTHTSTTVAIVVGDGSLLRKLVKMERQRRRGLWFSGCNARKPRSRWNPINTVDFWRRNTSTMRRWFSVRTQFPTLLMAIIWIYRLNELFFLTGQSFGLSYPCWSVS